MGPHFLHFGKWLRYTWQNGSITRGEGIFLSEKIPRPYYYIYFVITATFSKKKISGEKSLMIWNFFLLLLKMPSHQKNWSISFFSLKKDVLYAIRMAFYVLFYYILLLQQLFLKNKISGEKSLMIWNFFLLLLKMPSHQKNLWSISFFSLKKVLKNMFCMRSELHFTGSNR